MNAIDVLLFLRSAPFLAPTQLVQRWLALQGTPRQRFLAGYGALLACAGGRPGLRIDAAASRVLVPGSLRAGRAADAQRMDALLHAMAEQPMQPAPSEPPFTTDAAMHRMHALLRAWGLDHAALDIWCAPGWPPPHPHEEGRAVLADFPARPLDVMEGAYRMNMACASGPVLEQPFLQAMHVALRTPDPFVRWLILAERAAAVNPWDAPLARDLMGRVLAELRQWPDADDRDSFHGALLPDVQVVHGTDAALALADAVQEPCTRADGLVLLAWHLHDAGVDGDRDRCMAKAVG
jgi:hypothetical protein